MIIFRRPSDSRKNEPRKRGSFRPIILALILAVVCWSFWTNNQKRLDTLASQGLFTDETHSVSDELKTEVILTVKAFKKDFGIPLEVHVRSKPPPISAHDASRMYLDIVPSQGRVYLFLPPLVRHAVGDGFIRDMERSFAQDFASGDWRPGLVPALRALGAKLAEVTR